MRRGAYSSKYGTLVTLLLEKGLPFQVHFFKTGTGGYFGKIDSKPSYRDESRKSPERRESILHMLILTEVCLFKPICGAFEAEEKNSRREALLCRARGTYIVAKSCKQQLVM